MLLYFGEKNDTKKNEKEIKKGHGWLIPDLVHSLIKLIIHGPFFFLYMSNQINWLNHTN